MASAETTLESADAVVITADGESPTPPPLTPVFANSTNSVAPGPGTDGLDFTLALKPKGTPLFRLRDLYKSRLRVCIFLHFLLFLCMCVKLSEDVLDRMDIFILELEELYIPKPLIWEWMWTSSILVAFIGLSGLRRNRLSSMNIYAAGTFLFGICPLLGAAVYFLGDIWVYSDMKEDAELEMWQGYPVAVEWYVFIMIAFQVHLFSLYFAIKLIKMWRGKVKKG